MDTAVLLEEAIAFALDAVAPVTAAALGRPTPCAGWNLDMLLRHAADSLDALAEAAATGAVRLLPEAGPDGGAPPPDDPVAAFRDGAARLADVWADVWVDAAVAGRAVAVGGCPLHAGVVAGTGAIEIAVHGWDAAWAAGRPRPIPPDLAAALLHLASGLVTADTRAGLFAPPVPVPPGAGPHERLLAHLGRDPARPPRAA
ncbi:TIGR03086 family metal-binding protein [Actinomadura sp. WAC 06369]|uniref:TIGR03086 family metal-binding protein n=1 Tax=Actinomadura sp. WAC 06369 TaxID=2203193 RepID=UPI0018F59261|nr:TIGR03086 family metal-binding protein [Actinomadura sp. WAC 06369]